MPAHGPAAVGQHFRGSHFWRIQRVHGSPNKRSGMHDKLSFVEKFAHVPLQARAPVRVNYSHGQAHREHCVLQRRQFVHWLEGFDQEWIEDKWGEGITLFLLWAATPPSYCGLLGDGSVLAWHVLLGTREWHNVTGPLRQSNCGEAPLRPPRRCLYV